MLPSCQSRVHEVLQAHISVRFAVMILTPLTNINPPSTLPLDSLKSAQCLSVDLCICFHQLLDGISLMTITVVINLIKGEDKFRPLCTIARSLSGGNPCGSLGISLAPYFSKTLQWLPLSRCTYHCSSSLSFLQVNQLIPSYSHTPSPPL